MTGKSDVRPSEAPPGAGLLPSAGNIIVCNSWSGDFLRAARRLVSVNIHAFVQRIQKSAVSAGGGGGFHAPVALPCRSCRQFPAWRAQTSFTAILVCTSLF